MTRKTALVVALLLLLGGSAWAELELGLGIAPPIGDVPAQAQTGSFFTDATKVLHAGLSFWWLFYAGYDGLILPPYSVQQLTSGIDTGTGQVTDGYFRPGFLNTFNVGIRPRIGPISIMASVGINQLYVYRQDADGLASPPLGVNVKAGAGLRFAKWIGLSATVMSVFGDVKEMTDTFNALGGSDPFLAKQAEDKLLNNLFPVITLNLYL